MRMERVIKLVAALMLFGFSTTSVVAGCINDPVNFSILVGGVNVLGDNDFEYGVVAVNTTDTIVVSDVLQAGGALIMTDMTNLGLDGTWGASFGYTNTNTGLGANVEVQYNHLYLGGNGDFGLNTFNTDLLYFMLNVDWHAITAADNNAVAGGYLSLGGGLVNAYNAAGTMHYLGHDAVTGDGFISYAAFEDYDETTFALRFKVGLEVAVTDNAVLGLDVAFTYINEIDDFDPKYATVVTYPDDILPGATDSIFEQRVSIYMPDLYFVAFNMRATCFFGN